MTEIRRSDSAEPGYGRRRHGTGFTYLGTDGERLDDETSLDRIRELVIPPAWDDVWICADPLGHLQATGRDEAGRKQYLYHERWRELRDQEKFEHIEEFAQLLPDVRRRVARDLDPGNPNRESVLACAVRLLDLGSFRIGSEDYADEYGTYGLATVRKEHVVVRDDEIVFDYPAKHSKQRLLTLRDPDACALLKTLRRRRSGGPELLAYRHRRTWHEIRSEDINGYIHELAGEPFSAKDFRTWNATLLAAGALAVWEAEHGDGGDRAAASRHACEVTAGVLGNTPAVARSAYIDPRLLERFEAGTSLEGALAAFDDGRRDVFSAREQLELAVLDVVAGT
ncbi:MAG: DNA topoisomerase IB [Solirubrobacterales bacterium]